MKNLCILLFVVCFPVLLQAQVAYIVADSTYTGGVHLLDGGHQLNSRICRIEKDGKILEYTSEEVKEYGFRDGRVYVAKDVQIEDSLKRVFLERLIIGKATLYYYRGKGVKTYFLEKDSTLFVEVPRRNVHNERFSEQLLRLTDDCPFIFDACKQVSYTRKSFSKFVTRYNQCELRPFPHFRYGLLLGYDLLKMIPPADQNSDFKHFNYDYNGSMTIGLFMDQSILASDFSLYVELNYSKQGYANNQMHEGVELDYVVNVSTLQMPLLLRYTYPSNKVRPFINLGLVGGYHLKNESNLYSTKLSGNVIELSNEENTMLIDDMQLGYGIGGGLEYPLDLNNSLFFEMRYSKLYGVFESDSMKFSGFKFVTGLSF